MFEIHCIYNGTIVDRIVDNVERKAIRTLRKNEIVEKTVENC